MEIIYLFIYCRRKLILVYILSSIIEIFHNLKMLSYIVLLFSRHGIFHHCQAGYISVMPWQILSGGEFLSTMLMNGLIIQ